MTIVCMDLANKPGFPGCCDSCHDDHDSHGFDLMEDLAHSKPHWRFCCQVHNWALETEAGKRQLDLALEGAGPGKDGGERDR